MSAMTAGHCLTGGAMTGPAEAWKRQTFFDETNEAERHKTPTLANSELLVKGRALVGPCCGRRAASVSARNRFGRMNAN